MRICILLILILFMNACQPNDKNEEFRSYLKEVEGKLAKAYDTFTLASFNSAITGDATDYSKSEKAENALNKILSDKTIFESLKKFKDGNQVTNDTLKRALLVLYNQFVGKQIDTNFLNKMTKLSSTIEKKFSTFRAKYDGKEVSDNEIEDILKKENNTDKLKTAWMAHKEIGNAVASDIIQLVKLRNESARKLGYKNYHEMTMVLGEQDPEELTNFFDELDKLTRDAFVNLKREIDSTLSIRYKIDKTQLMPWHYQNRYFQEAPKLYDLDLDHFYKDKNIESLTKKYYSSIDMPIDELVAKSDLYEKHGKNQHAFCTDIDRDKNDIRVVCNIQPTQRWMETMLHEYGHAVYQKYVGQSLPWTLKQPAHTFTTEGIAMLFGRFATMPSFMNEVAGMSSEEANKINELSHKQLQLQQLVFSRWVQVVYRFEKSMYENPDQDLNKLWWDIVEKYQMMKRPEGRNSPDWATKIHIALYPCYYHNYLLGEIFASQFYYHINTKVLGNSPSVMASFYGRKEASKFLKDKVFDPALLYNWKEMIEKATGEKFTPKYYALQFVK